MGGQIRMPEVTFSAFIISLASSALVGLGEAPDPVTGAKALDLELARHNIDTLDMLRRKTAGNLDADEESLLCNVICELRLKFVINCDSSSCQSAAV